MQLQKFDKAILILYTPERLYLAEWDGMTYYSTNGLKSAVMGGCIQIRGPSGELNWKVSLERIITSKLPGKLIAEISYDEPQYADLFQRTTQTAHVYEGLPLSTFSTYRRGIILEAFARRCDSVAGPTKMPQWRTLTSKRGWEFRCIPSHDWDREDGIRVEAKSAQFSYLPSQRMWFFHFHHVKPDKFDCLQLVCYTPHGLYVGEWNGERFATVGRELTDVTGGVIRLYGPTSMDWQAALEVVLRDKFPGVIHAFMPWPEYSYAAFSRLEMGYT